MSCGFGAVVLVFLIIDHAIEVEYKTLNADVLSEIALLDEDIREGEAGLVRLRNALTDADADIVEAQGLASRVTEELSRFEALTAAMEESGVTTDADIEAIKAEINRLEQEVKELRESAEADGGRSARDFSGDGQRQYLTGLNLGGSRILILLDASASMLSDQLVNIIRLRNMDEALQLSAEKWVRARATVDWLMAQLPINSRFQLVVFNTQARFVLPETANIWIDVADSDKLEKLSEGLGRLRPEGGTSLHNAFSQANAFNSRPDNIFLITDGLPTQGTKPPRGPTISGPDRLRLFREAAKLLPKGVPVNIILAPMEGDPLAASEFWRLAQDSGGSFMSPARDWP